MTPRPSHDVLLQRRWSDPGGLISVAKGPINGATLDDQALVAQRDILPYWGFDGTALTLSDARRVSEEGAEARKTVIASVGHALLSVGNDLAADDLLLAEDVAARALGLITTFHCRHQKFPVGPTPHR